MKRREIVVEQADAVGPDRRPRDDRPRSAPRPGVDGRADAPLDETLESFA